MSAQDEEFLTELQSKLGNLRPHDSRLNRDQLMYMAGQAAGSRRSTVGLSALGLSSFCAVMFAALFFLERIDKESPESTSSGAQVARFSPPDQVASPDAHHLGYLIARNQMVIQDNGDWLSLVGGSTSSEPGTVQHRSGTPLELEQLLDE